MKGNEMKGGDPEYPEIQVPSRAEFVAACELRGVPAWFAASDHSWRSEQPASRWPRVNWQVAVTSVLDRWRAAGAPLEPGRRNGLDKKAPGAWELKQRLEALQAQAQSHLANENSPAWTGDSTEAERDELVEIQKKIAGLELEMGGHDGANPTGGVNVANTT